MEEVRLRHLTLVYNADNGGGGSGESPLSSQDPWRQLKLFGEGEGTVIYASPENCELQELVLLLTSAHIKQIFDLRDVPYLAFNGGSRAKFLDMLSRLKVGYCSYLALETKKKSNSFFSLTDEIQKCLEAGPTMVFSDTEPKDDPEVAKIDSDLSRAVKPYHPVFLSLQ